MSEPFRDALLIYGQTILATKSFTTDEKILPTKLLPLMDAILNVISS